MLISTLSRIDGFDYGFDKDPGPRVHYHSMELSRSAWQYMIVSLAIFLVGIGVGRVSEPSRTGLVALPGASTSTGRVLGIGQSPRIELADDVDFNLFWETWQMVRNRYYERPVSDKDLFYGALTGLVDGVGDPYTTFFPPQEAEEFTQQLEGRFEGIGAQIEIKDGLLVVVAPLEGSPAEKAGLRPGDGIGMIDGKPTDSMSVDQAARTIRGPKGTPVTITVIRGKTGKPFALTIVRDQIQMKSVKLSWDGSFAIVEIDGFNTDTQALFEQATQDIRAKKAKGIILDVRNNPGGAVTAAQTVAGAWIGNEILFQERRQGKIVEAVRAIGRGELSGIPTVVLINQGSASASEIVAGALQDHGQAVTVGAKTFGKGSVQEYEELKDGSALKVTIAEWLTPNDRVIHHVGLEPMIHVQRTDADYDAKRDPQLERAKQFLREGGTPTSFRAASSTVPTP